MPDDKSKRGPQDSNRINLNEDYEVEYWTRKFGCTKNELRETVARVGSIASEVQIALNRPGKS